MPREDVFGKMRAIAEETAHAFGLSLFDFEYRTGGRRWWFRVTLDREEGEVTLADCEAVSRQYSVRLDVEDLVPHPYEIEVSSPGLERPLRCAADYRRFAGKKAKVVMGPGGPDAGQAFEGVIGGCDEDTVRLDTGGPEAVALPLGRIKSARLIFEFR